MGLFSKKKTEMDLPPAPPAEFKKVNLEELEMPAPPPLPDLGEMRGKGDFPMITPGEELPELPPIPPEEEFQHIPEEEAVQAPKEKAPEPIQRVRQKPARTPIPQEPLLREEPTPTAPITKHLFVSVQDYKIVFDNVELIKNKLKQTDDILVRLHEIKKEQEDGLEAWKQHLENVQQKLVYVDQMLFKGG